MSRELTQILNDLRAVLHDLPVPVYPRKSKAQSHLDILQRILNQAVFAEQLNIKGLGRTRLARSISDAAWGELLRQLAYKASWHGRTFWQAPKNFASSKLYPAEGARLTT